MTRAVVAGRDRGVFHLRGTDETNLSVIRIIGSSGDLLGAYRRSSGGPGTVASLVGILWSVASLRAFAFASTATRFTSSTCAIPGVLLGVCTAGGRSPSTASAATTTTTLG